jgi:predicted nucleic acid-binding protein
VTAKSRRRALQRTSLSGLGTPVTRRDVDDRVLIAGRDLIDAEVGQVLRRFALRRDISGSRATALLDDYLDLPVRRYPDGVLLGRAFQLRANVSVYDGLYLALAEVLGCPLLTGDGSLAGVPGSRAAVEVVATSA